MISVPAYLCNMNNLNTASDCETKLNFMLFWSALISFFVWEYSWEQEAVPTTTFYSVLALHTFYITRAKNIGRLGGVDD